VMRQIFHSTAWFSKGDLDGFAAQLLGGITQYMLLLKVLPMNCGIDTDMVCCCSSVVWIVSLSLSLSLFISNPHAHTYTNTGTLKNHAADGTILSSRKYTVRTSRTFFDAERKSIRRHSSN